MVYSSYSFKALTKNRTNAQLKSQQNTVVCGYPALTLNYTVDAARMFAC
jgi:hypothetical protein